MRNRSFDARSSALLALGLALVAAGTWMSADSRPSRVRMSIGVVLSILAAVFAHRAWRASRAP